MKILLVHRWLATAASRTPTRSRTRSSCTSRRPRAPPATPIELEAMIDAPYAEKLVVRWRAVGEPTWHDIAVRSLERGRLVRRAAAGRAAAASSTTSAAPTSPAHEVDHFASAAGAARRARRCRAQSIASRRTIARASATSATRSRSTSSATTSAIATTSPTSSCAASSRTRTACCARSTRSASASARSSGKTPRPSRWRTPRRLKGLRYGFGADPRARASVGVPRRLASGSASAQEGFERHRARRRSRSASRGARACRSAASTSAASAPARWVRLQWDTAPPLLMGASIVRTDLPGAVIESAGLYVAYDVAYRIADRVTVQGAGLVRPARRRRRTPAAASEPRSRSEVIIHAGGNRPVGQPQQGRAAPQLARRARIRRRAPPASRCLDNGAYGLTLHWRADNRHTRAGRRARAARAVRSSAAPSSTSKATTARSWSRSPSELRVTQFTLVPVKPGEITSDHGWDLPRQHDVVAPIVAAAAAAGHPHGDLRRSGARA